MGLLFGSVAGAEQKAPAPDKAEALKFEAANISDFSKEVAMLSQIVAFAEANKDALIMISAVRLLDSLPFEGVAKPGTDEKAAARYERKEMLNQAKEFAAGDAEVLAVVAKLEETPEAVGVRHHGGPHGGYHGGYHGGHHGGYHGSGYWHPRRHHCVWVQYCGPWGCEWICR
ncbi:MAG: hypothetical protein BWK76_01030 [Desulfobulbaceae bacterium A2]|nr:MAG: hypothetical protein BWK76_01030 [Desulfobulbaceae bacterium A2]